MENYSVSPLLSRSPLTLWQEWSRGGQAVLSAREIAYQILRDRIIYLDLKPGEILNDKLLAEELEMSRTPVREALIRLNTANLVLLRPQRGTFVAPVNVRCVEVEQFARYTMEKEVVSLAIYRMTPELRLRYEENLRQFHLAEQTQDPTRARVLLELDNSFHALAYEAAEKLDCYYFLMNAVQHMERLRVLSLTKPSDNVVLQDHRALLGAMMEGDLPETHHLLELHMTRYRDSLAQIQRDFPQYFSLSGKQ